MDNNNNNFNYAQGQNYVQGQNYNQGFSKDNIPPEYQPISMWGYFGYELLFAIPFIGFILLIIFCFAPSNINVKNFARSYFCFIIIALILTVIAGLIFGGALVPFIVQAN